MHAITATRQAVGRAIHAPALRRTLGTWRHQLAHAANSLHQAQLRTLIQWTHDAIEKVDAEMAALPHERADHERCLLTLEQRLREVQAAAPAQPISMQADQPSDIRAFAAAWAAGRTGYAFQPCTTDQLYRAYRQWLSHHGLRLQPAHQQRFNTRLRELLFEQHADVELEAHITGLMTDDVRVVRCWLPLQQLPQDLHERRRYIDASISSFERSLTSTHA